MSKPAPSLSFLQLLLRVYNQPVQAYDHFPDVILCGSRRIDRGDFDALLQAGYLEPYFRDSFGSLYRTSKKAEVFLHQQLTRRTRWHRPLRTPVQTALPFCW